MPDTFQIATLNSGLLQPSIALATHRAGELAVLDFEYCDDYVGVRETLQQFCELVQSPFGVRLDGDTGLLANLLPDLPPQVKTVIITSVRPQDLQEHVLRLREKKVTTLLEATCLEQARTGAAIGVDGLVAKGHEAGGRIADETTFILLQRYRAEVPLPVWAHGGVGLHTVGACAAAGAAGVILDAQLALTRESPLPEIIRARIAAMDGSETVCVGDQLGETYRVYARPGNPVVKELQDVELRLAARLDAAAAADLRAEWRAAVARRAGWQSEQNALLLGQDAAFAAPLAQRFRTVAGVLQGMREAVRAHCGAAVKLRPLAEGSPLAKANGTRYPILQGPMTRVSDVPEFAARVAEGGALPFLALALMRGPEVRNLLAEAQRKLTGLPWGVGILGFVPPELRQEQMDAITEYRPPFALIAGGRPDQARGLEEKGIPTYLHVPSPGLLRMFVQQGARRFIFEGRECGGHVGPRTSFVLWNQMVEVLLSAPELAATPEEFHIVFAAGIHDALSAAMVSVIAAPLAERGVRIGALIGTAYLFTREAVASGAILETFQEEACRCRNTVLLETGPGHSTRCVDTPFAAVFAAEKRRLLTEGRPAEEVRLTLEDLNLGRLRIASKGVTRNPRYGEDPSAPKLIQIGKTEQLSQGMYMIGQVAALRHTTCTVSDLHRDVSAGSSHLLEKLAGRTWQAPAAPVTAVSSDVAIVGMACLLPKAPDLQTYWENVLHKVDAVTEIPKDRWDWERYYDSDPKAKDKIYSRWGGFLDDIPFDPMQYGMPPASLRSIEPSQLLALEVVRAALADAGYLGRPFARERTSVILGAGGGAADLGLGYGARSFLPALEDLPEFRGRSKEIIERLDDRLPEWTEDSFAGILTNVAAGRIANRFDLGGSNYTVDAACASSLAAVSLALRELESGASDMVIVGGVDTMQNPFTYLCFSKTHALSPTGRCKTFDESADGIAISEGIAILVFKRLADAERDGDRIYAVIKAAGSSSDGKDRGLTAPRPEGQARALRRAYAKAGVSPATVGLVEAHGTGTVAGDSAEVQALTTVFREAEAARQGCAIGSVKSMIGHTKCTAGAAGLVKAALALYHRVLPPTLGVEKPNPRARFPETPFFVNTEARPWLESPDGHPRRAGVSAFGFGGTNFHVVLEEYTGNPFSAKPAPLRRWSEELFFFRADSRQGLLETIGVWEKALDGGAKPPLCDLAFTAWKDAQEKSDRAGAASLQLAIVAASVEDLRQKLGWSRQHLSQPETVRIQDPRGIYFSGQPLARQGKIAFLFPGQGSQYPRMLQDLFLHFPEMRETFEKAVRVLTDKLEPPLSAYVFPPPSFSREEEKGRQQALTATNIAQPALGAVSMAMFGLLRDLGLEPDMAAGHSYGEYVALAAAGVMDFATLMQLSEARGRFIVEGAGDEPGTMAAVEADSDTVLQTLPQFEGVCLANANAPRQSVISGPRKAVERAVEHFAARNITARLIPVACAFHSPLVAPAQDRLAQFLSTVKLAEPRITVYSNTTAEPYPTEPAAMADRLVEHLAQPVEFVREIRSMYEAGARIFVEVGPRSVLTSLVDQILDGRPAVAVASNQSGRPGLTQLLHLLGQLAAHGCAVQLDRLYRDRSARRLHLNTVQREFGEKPLPPSVWLVNGARAKPLKEAARIAPRAISAAPAPVAQSRPAETPAPRALAAAASASSSSVVMHAAPHRNGPSSSQSSAPVTVRIPLAAGAPVAATASISTTPMSTPSVSADGVQHVMSQFQQTMTRFLDTQKSVMLAYLGTDPGVSAPAVAQAQVAPARQAVLPAFETPVAAPVPQAEAQVAVAPPPPPPAPEPVIAAAAPVTTEPLASPAGPDRKDLTAKLLAIVSERTGYPPEMLDLNLDLEADLGIDSIKRVEILGTFQQSFAADGAVLPEGLMEKLAGVRTLQGIIDRVCDQSPSSAPDVPSTPAPPAAPSSRGPGREELTAKLLAIVSERTGYPPEMLDLNLDLEADLGIDSIKRVEILGTFQQSFAGDGAALPEGLMEKLAGVRTLQGILDRVLEEEAPPAEAVRPHRSSREEPAPGQETGSDEDIRRFTLTTVKTPLAGVSKPLPKDRPILIADAGHALGGELAGQLIGQGYSVVLVRQGAVLQETGPGSYLADMGSAESVTALIAEISQRHGAPCAIVHLLSLQGEPAFEPLDYQAWKQQLRLGVKSLFHLAKSAGKHLREAAAQDGAALLAVTGMGGSFLTDLPAGAGASFPDHGAVAGLMKTLAIEWPEVRVRAVDVDPGEDASALATRLFEELHAIDPHAEAGYSGQDRITIQPVHAPLHPGDTTALQLDSSSVVLITGGARGITARAAKRLAELYRPTLVLVGRTPLPQPEESRETAGITAPRDVKAALMEGMRARGETVTPALVERAYSRLIAEREVRSNLADLRQLGARVHYHAVDVRNADAFGAFIDEMYASFGRIDGVIHGAGVIEDKLLDDKTPESFDRVFDTKVDSAFVLSRKLRPDGLRFLVFFSSVSGRFGNRGQADYAAANEVLNKLAVCLDRAWPGRVVAINWGPWDTEGMVSDEVRRQFAERGVKLISAATGLRRLEEELNFGKRGEAEVVIGGAGWLSQDSWPLLGKATPSRDESAVEFVREINPAYDLYLNDHRLDGQPVLPLAIATELIAEAVAIGWPQMQVAAVSDLRLLHGVVLDNGPRTVRITARPQTATTIAVEILGTGQPQRVHYRATVELAERLPEPPSLQPPPLTDGNAFSMDVPELYRRWLFHGPTFHGIKRVDLVGVSGIRAALATCSPSGWIAGTSAASWLIDPLMFDSALQLLVLWAREHWDMTALPTGFRSFRRFPAPPPAGILCELRLRPDTGGQTIHADIFFLDAASGRVVSILEDMQGACSKALNRLAGRQFAAAAANQL